MEAPPPVLLPLGPGKMAPGAEKLLPRPPQDAHASASTTATGSTESERRGSSHHKFAVTDFLWGSVLGEGSYARVVHARLKKGDKKHYAVKIMEKRHLRRENKVKQALMEKNILSRVSHEFIVKLWFTFQDSDSLYMVMDLVEAGELLSVIRHHKDLKVAAGVAGEACGKEASRFYLGELVLALEYLHSEGIVHRDIKPENILVSADGHIKLTDFGTASWNVMEGRAAATRSPASEAKDNHYEGNGGERHHSFVGTAEYVSPEVLVNELATRAVDLWAAGCILFQLMTGDMPFHGDSDYLTFQEIMSHCDGTRPLQYPPVLEGEAGDLIRRLLLRESTARLGAGEPESENDYNALKRHPFFDGLDWEAILGVRPPYVPPCSHVVSEPLRDGATEDWLLLEPEATPLQLEPMNSFSQEMADEEELSPEDVAWQQFLHPGERILLTSLVWKRKGLMSRKRQLMLTTTPRLLYVDPSLMELKGEVPWSSNLKPEARSDGAFDVHTPGRVYYFTVVDQEVANAHKWVSEIKAALEGRVALGRRPSSGDSDDPS